jgi:hypothetical protein
MTKRIPEICRRPQTSPTALDLDSTRLTTIESRPILTTTTMPPRLNLFTANKTVSALRQSTTPALSSPRSIASPARFRAVQSVPLQKRWNSSRDGSKKVEPQPDEQTFPTSDQLPHVSEEAAEISRIMDKEKRCDGVPSTPELDQGTPVEEVRNPNLAPTVTRPYREPC